jgi:predicted nucleotidyltransferase
MNAEIEKHLSEIEALCRKYGVAMLELFGSATGPRFDETTSDFDFVATFSNIDPESDYGGRYLDFCRSLESLLGRPVDVVTPASIKRPSFRMSVDSTRQLVYDARLRRAIA